MLEQGVKSTRDAAGSWSRHLLRAFLLPVLVLLPTVGAAFAADKRFNVYRFGGEYAQRPSGVVTDQIRNIDFYLSLGNFRPLGRIVERSQDLLTFQLAEFLSVPFHVSMRVVNLISVGLLSVLCVLVAAALATEHPVSRQRPATHAVLTPLAFASLLIIVNGNSSVVLFTDLYAASVAVVLGASLLAARHDLLHRSSLSLSAYAAAAVLGVVLASFNEVAALALPAMVIAIIARGRLTLNLSMSALMRSAAARVTAMTWLGFLAVTVPVRAVIARRCAEGECYAASDVSVSADAAVAFAHRVASALPGGHVFWLRSGELADWRSFAHIPTLLLVASIVAIAFVSLRQTMRTSQPPSRALFAPVLFGTMLIIIGSLMASLSRDLQQQIQQGLPVGSGWRETLIVLSGTALVLASLTSFVARSITSRLDVRGVHPVHAGVATLLAFMAVVAMLGNASWTRQQVAGVEPALHNRIAVQMVSPAADEGIRCALFREFTEINDNEEHRIRLAEALDWAEQSLRGRPWCQEGP
jgi:hypothetical protein